MNTYDAKRIVKGHFGLKLMAGLVAFVVLGLFGALMVRAMFFTWVDNYQFAYTFDYWTGKQATVQHNGYVFSPFYLRAVHTIDLRPMQVSISTIQRVLNAKLVHFDPYAKDPETGLLGWELFIKWHGRDSYEGPGTMSGAGGGGGSGNLFREILTNYAYDGTGKSYPFLVVEKELKGDTVVDVALPGAKPPEAKQ